MDRSIRRLTDPITGSAHGERRRSVRQKLHTPVYASFSGPQTGMVVDLSELLDLHEDGFAVQTSERLEMNRAVTLCLDLPETSSYIHGTGQVVWSDDTGRGGIRFSALSDSSRKILKEWLFANLLIASSNHAARTEQMARREEERPEPEDQTGSVVSLASVVSIDDESRTLAAVEAVRGEVRAIAGNVDAILQLIADRAQSLTGSSGAALAFLTDYQMICRARTGDPAPPLGAALNTREGLSGECVRSGRRVWCEDTENDPRVDPDVCRVLGIGSLMAAPIVSDFRVVGVLEVFSPHPHSFTAAQGMVLDQLVEMIPRAPGVNVQPQTIHAETPITADHGVPAHSLPTRSHSIEAGLVESNSAAATPEAMRAESFREKKTALRDPAPQLVPERMPETARLSTARLLYRALLGLGVAVVVAALGYWAGPALKNWLQPSPATQQLFNADTGVKVAEAAASDERPTDLSLVNSRSDDSGSLDHRSGDYSPQPSSLSELRKMAVAGDPEAQWQLGIRYHNGNGIARDDAQAVKWFELAAEQGNVAAQGALGAYYWSGRGVPEDLTKAYFWSAIAMAQGDAMSKARIEGLSSQMTRPQVSAARQQAELWIHTHNQRAKSEAN
jgi:GAF domain-containing protein/Sel1 repeat-containing protein/PilZ domain-containing protein